MTVMESNLKKYGNLALMEISGEESSSKSENANSDPSLRHTNGELVVFTL